MGKKYNRKNTRITIGIPRALLYYKYKHLWETFLYSLEIDYIVSPPTTKAILTKGINLAVDETCLPSKVYLGHVDWLVDKCDYVLVPRIADFGKHNTVCTKHQAMVDVLKNTFRDETVKFVHYSLERDNLESEVSAFLKLGKTLGKTNAQTMLAFWNAKQAQRASQLVRLNEQKKRLDTNQLKILVVSHDYNINDGFVGEPVIKMLEALGTVPINGSVMDEKTAIQLSKTLSDTLPWKNNRELLGAIAMYKDAVDGMILLSSFPCGPDSMVNEIVLRRVHDLPVLNLILDGQEASAGLETRLESFVDIITFRKTQQGQII